MNRKLVLLVSLILALISAGLVWYYISTLEQQYAAAGRKTTVLVARDYIPANTVLSESMVTATSVPGQYLQPGAITSVRHLRNEKGLLIYTVMVPIMLGEQITATKLAAVGLEAGLALAIPPNRRAVSIPIDEVSGVNGLIRPGNYVDIIATFDYTGKKSGTKTTLLYQKMLVLAIGREVLGTPTKKVSKSGKLTVAPPSTEAGTITLSVSPEEAQVLTFASEKAKLRFVLRPTGDDSTVSIPETMLSDLLGVPEVVPVNEPRNHTPAIIRGIQEQLHRQFTK